MAWNIEEIRPDVPMEIVKGHLSRIINRGPERVVINEHGEACPPKRAADYGAKCDIILVRNDAWSVGTSCEYFPITFNLYPETWIAVLINETKLDNNICVSESGAHSIVKGCLSSIRPSPTHKLHLGNISRHSYVRKSSPTFP